MTLYLYAMLAAATFKNKNAGNYFLTMIHGIWRVTKLQYFILISFAHFNMLRIMRIPPPPPPPPIGGQKDILVMKYCYFSFSCVTSSSLWSKPPQINYLVTEKIYKTWKFAFASSLQWELHLWWYYSWVSNVLTPKINYLVMKYKLHIEELRILLFYL